MRGWSPIILGVVFGLSIGRATAQGVRVTPATNINPEVGGKTLDEWIKLVDDRDPSVREHAIRMIGSLGSNAKKAVPALTRQLAMPNDLSPVASAAIAIGQIVPDDPAHVKNAVFALTKLLNSNQQIIRYQAATALGHIGKPDKDTLPKLVSMIRDPMSWELRRTAAYALGRLGRDDLNFPDIRALEALAETIDDNSKEVRVEALQGLINLGPPASPPDQMKLREMLIKRVRADRDRFAAIWIRVALLRMKLEGEKEIDGMITYIAKLLKSPEPGIPADAARALGACGPIAKAKIADLIAAMQTSDVALTVWAAWALGRMGPDAKSALPGLNLLLESADPNIKAAAQDAISQINGAKR